ncbi:hypothetical protein CAEBREN_15620 [Caenorhabditis brenneri]|uniref:Uncharacterized protein n=1 Tax=Caenorhabditis brenneri TaxID=135651 RepID=G0MVW0_CAEBE|nr:hypothetical protein CAEBREN_15620 [Caenorhabditis brenneri]
MSSEIYEKAFAKSDKTDAILVVDGKKLHVNKTWKTPRNFWNSPIASNSQPLNVVWSYS